MITRSAFLGILVNNNYGTLKEYFLYYIIFVMSFDLFVETKLLELLTSADVVSDWCVLDRLISEYLYIYFIFTLSKCFRSLSSVT